MRPSPSRLLDLREYPVLYVDDERENLRIFELSFRREFKILTALDAQQGLALLHEHPVALVLSDHKMPGMSGVEFLARVKELDPGTVRILVTAYGDAQTLQAAINNGAIYRFVAKPWNPDEMRVTLKRGIEVYSLERERAQLLHEFSLLHRASKAIGRELEVERLEQLLLDLVTQDFGYDAAALIDSDPGGTRLSFRRFSGEVEEVADALRALDLPCDAAPEFFAGLRAGAAQLLRGDDVLQLSPPLRAWVSEVAAAELLVLPLIGKAGLLGALAVDNRRGGRGFSGDDRSLLEGLAQQAAAGLENARLVEALRRSQERAQRADRLGTLGSLTSGVAQAMHEALAAASGFLAPGAPSSEATARARRELERMGGLLETLRRLAPGAAGAPRELCDLGAVAADALRLLEARASEAGVELRLERAAGDASLLGDRGQLQQLALQLGLNALQASPRGAVARIRVAGDPARAEALLEVHDAGPGIPDEALEGLFDPFSARAEPGPGKGLGLRICQQVAVAHGGQLEVQSRPGQTCFRVRLPSARAPEPR